MFSATKGGSPSGYQISRSVRLRSSASAYFNRTFSTPTSTTTWSLSFWLKRGNLTSNAQIFSAGGDFIYFGGGVLLIKAVSGAVLETTQVFRDPSSFYHFVVVADTSNATANNRVRLYVNGTEVTAFSSRTNPSQNAATIFNASSSNNRIGGTGSIEFFDGYLTEINFIDGQALTPSSFGQTDATTGVWSPIKYTGTYGTNGFYLNFSDNSAATATTIGKDNSGNGNNWTPNNISVTAGITYDSMLDVPTQWADGGNGRGNYAVLNPLAKDTDVTLSSGNLDFSCTSSGLGGAIGTIAVSSGKWYWEVTVTGGTASAVGIAKLPLSAYDANQTGTYLYLPSGDKRLSPSTDSSYGASYTTNDVIGVALDMDAGTVVFYKNNSSQGTAFSSLSGDFTAWLQDGTSGSASTFVANFGQRPFSYTPPTGFKALNTLNLPTPTILKGNQYFDATTYTGNSGTQSVVNSGAMQPDLVWIKDRSAVGQHVLTDSVRGVDRQLFSSLTNAEQTSATGITSLNSNGFTTGANPSPTGATNSSPDAFIAWQWKEGATQGFDIVTYTGTGATLNVSHNLGVVPSMIITKSRSATGGWPVYHVSIGATGAVQLESTGATSTTSAYWNNTAPTSTQFTLASGLSANGTTYVAYLFAAVAGYSAFGSYTGNGSTDGTFVFTGFLPRYVMVKRTDSTGGWAINDTARDPINMNDAYLAANTSGAEIQPEQGIDILSNGFKLRSNGTITNASGGTFIYLAFASNPFKNSLAF